MISGTLFLTVFGIFPATAHAADFYFSPSSGEYDIGKTLSVSVYVSSSDQAMNVASGVVSFSQDKLEVTSLSKDGSILTLWVQEPAFSNSAGTVNFEGIALNPGFTGNSGKIITINFRVKSAGAAIFNFSSGSILANDGMGTNILSNLGNATFSLNSSDQAPKEPAVQKQSTAPEQAEESSSSVNAPAAPKVSSSTHSDPEKWYNNNNPKFEIFLPKGITGVNVLADKNPTTNPGTRSDGLFSSYSYEDVDDGIWYFHIRLRNASGWGEITHFRFQIDTVPPDPINIQFIDGKEIIQPRMNVTFNTADALSGIDYYQIKISDFALAVSFNEVLLHNPYTLPPVKPGIHTIQVIAFDKAGNSIDAEDKFAIKPGISPEITNYPQKLGIDENLEIKGETVYPEAKIIIWLQRDGDEPESYNTESNKEGIFAFTGKEKLTEGVYKLWAVIIDDQAGYSKPSEKVTIVVGKSVVLSIKSWLITAGSLAIGFLTIAIPLIALVIFLMFLIWHSWHKFSKLKIKAKKEIVEAERVMRKILDKSKKNIKDQIEILEEIRERRALIEEEERKIIEQLQNDLKHAQGFTKKNKDIKQEIE